ncbi:MAG: hypothetical protein ACREYF_29350 [Gammaproteobacteria bacterium]
MPHSRKASTSALTNSGRQRPGLKLDLSQEGFEVFLDHLVEDGVFGTPPLVVDAPSILRALIPAFAGRQGPRAWLSILKAPSRATTSAARHRYR